MTFRTYRRRLAFAPLFLIFALMTACSSDPIAPPDEHDEEPEVIRLEIGGEILDIDAGETLAITIPLGATDIGAIAFFDDDGDELDIHDDEFELRFEAEDESIVTFTRSEAFAGTLNGLTAGTTNVDVLLWHLDEDHDDFAAVLVVTVTDP